jgi:hypothetical protein
MKKFSLYVHERIEVGDNIILETKLRTDKVYIAEVLMQDLKEPNISREIGFLTAYFDEHPTMEDAKPYWLISYVVSSDYKQNVGENMGKIMDALFSKKKIGEPALIHNINEAPFIEGGVIHIQRGKIFPDDE